MSEYIYFLGRWIYNPNKFIIFLWKLKGWFNKWILIDLSKYYVIPNEDMKRYFELKGNEYNKAQALYKEKGTLEYQFYPTGIGWGTRVKVIKTGEIIDITDTKTW